MNRNHVDDWFSRRRLGLFLHFGIYAIEGWHEQDQMLRSLQPRMVINNRGFDEGDFGTPERECQKSDTDRTICFVRPTEACNSVGPQSWGYRKDEDYYTSQFLMQSIDGMMAKGAHYLLNVGPDAKGSIPDAASEIIQEIGKWYRRVREAFSDTKGSRKNRFTQHRDNIASIKSC